VGESQSTNVEAFSEFAWWIAWLTTAEEVHAKPRLEESFDLAPNARVLRIGALSDDANPAIHVDGVIMSVACFGPSRHGRSASGHMWQASTLGTQLLDDALVAGGSPGVHIGSRGAFVEPGTQATAQAGGTAGVRAPRPRPTARRVARQVVGQADALRIRVAAL
jgi:hypothetical protein